jgi:CBS domain-containing protein
MRARELMSHPVVTVMPDTPVKEVAALLVSRCINAVPVIDAQGGLVGIVSEADLVSLETMPDPRRHAIPTGNGDGPIPVTARDVMTADVVAAPGDADVAEIARTMVDRHIKQIPILSDGHVVGIVARRDLLRVLAREDEEIRAELQDLLDEELFALGRFHGEVSRGVVTLHGPGEDRGRRLASMLARSVPGVVAVRFAGD